ncbi:TIGR02678 family protein [Algiphilus sp. NNCM1]|uniref:TIGR02678 family protein n=1 Tax=Algiphilus sp. TaxID=1872431 RepID=UPI001CA6C38F|nr:TIGR02678 family protein [Algiphilus sp.]MBY8965957.1 TIGR02678 family protein [Algiphilus acroporae]MCI5062394.1 TIGR02678 family protein [Algiphilus sp.]MCI5102320.1 TIGR02678 family protein [Algiphilus sp.]
MSEAAVPDALSQQRQEERERAVRTLLLRPLLSSNDEALALIRGHADWLRPWFQREAGWILHVERACARLYKRPADLGDASRGAPGFDRRRYVLLCLACSALERSGPQTSLQELGRRVLELAAYPELRDAGFHFSLDSATERRELVHVCRWLLEQRVLSRVVGDEESFVAQSGDALYDINRRVLSLLLAVSRGPSSMAPESAPRDLEARLQALGEEFVPDSAEGRRGAQRHHIARRLLDDPVLYFEDLDEGTHDYLMAQRGPLAARLSEGCGLQPEQRREGLALVDPDGELTDRRLPAEGTSAHVTLLVAGHLGEQLRAAPGCSVARSAIATFVRGAADEYGRYWRKQAREPGAEHALAEEALAALAALDLVHLEADTVTPRPALARFAAGSPEIRQSGLFEA